MSPTQYVFGNFFETELVVGVTAAGTTLLVPPSMSIALPVCAPTVPSVAQLVLWDGVLPPEIVACTANPQTGSLTVLRAQEGTSAQAWGAGTQIRSALTAQIINSALAAYFNIQQVLASAFLPLTGGTLSGPLLLNADPTAAFGAATKEYVDNVQGNKLPLTGGTMQGTINMNSNRIISLPLPISSTEPARLQELNAEQTARLKSQADTSGVLTTAGTNQAYVLTSNTGYTGLVDGICIRTKFHVANDSFATLAVDSTPATPIQIISGVAVPEGAISAGTPIVLTYVLAVNAWVINSVVLLGFNTGDVKFTISNTADPGWIMCNDGTIGNIASGATFADASAQALFIKLWNNVSNANAPVTGGRGANALADWTAQKPIALTKMLGRALAVAGTGSGLSARGLGDVVGEETHLLSATEMPSHNHPVSDPGHTNPLPGGLVTSTGAGGPVFTGGSSGGSTPSTNPTTGTATTGITILNTGGGGAHNNMQPSSFLNAMIKL